MKILSRMLDACSLSDHDYSRHSASISIGKSFVDIAVNHTNSKNVHLHAEDSAIVRHLKRKRCFKGA